MICRRHELTGELINGYTIDIRARRRNAVERDSTLKYSLAKGFGEFFWNLCPSCGCASAPATLWEDGTVEYGECLVCKRMAEIMELEEIFSKGKARQ